MVSSDVVWSAHLAAFGVAPAPGIEGGAGCGRCGSVGAVMTPVKQVVSKQFTAYSRWLDPGADTLCQACVWLYRNRSLRSDIHLVRRSGPTLGVLTEWQLAQFLSAPLPHDTAVIVPSRMGRKHIFADAQWGHIAVDDAQIPWTDRDVVTLAAVMRLRQLGFSERHLLDPAPDYTILHKLPRARWCSVLEDWQTIDGWRTAPPWWTVAIRSAPTLPTTPGIHGSATKLSPAGR